MAASPVWKVYLGKEYRAACKYVEEAACLVAFLGDGKAAQWGGTLLGTRRRTTPPSFSKAKGLDPAAILTSRNDNQENAA